MTVWDRVSEEQCCSGRYIINSWVGVSVRVIHKEWKKKRARAACVCVSVCGVVRAPVRWFF